MISYFKQNLREFIIPTSKVNLDLSRTDRILVYVSIVASVFALYILSIQGNIWLLVIKQLIFVIVPFTLGCRLLVLKKLNLWFFALSTIVLIYVLITKRLDVVGEYFLLCWMLFLTKFESKLVFDTKRIRNLGLLLCIIIGFHFFFFDSKSRESIGGLDPNYSSYLIFLVLPFALISKSYLLHIIIFYLGFQTKSRGFFVAINFYLFTLAVLKIFPRLNFSSKKFFLLLLSLFSMVIAFSFVRYSYGIETYSADDNTLSRFFNLLNNRSDHGRWEANVHFLKAFSSDLYLFYFGSTPEDYFQKISTYLPHNLPLLEFATHGMFIGASFLAVFFYVLKDIYNVIWLPIFVGLLVYWLFLGIEIGAIYNVYFVGIITILYKSFPKQTRKVKGHNLRE